MRLLLSVLLISFPAFGETLHMHLPVPIVDLDWTGATTMSNAALVTNLQEGLFSVDPKSNQLIPQVAESVTKSKDLKTYTFKIRKTAKWSDGRSIYAKDFVDAWQRVISPQSSSIYYFYFFDILNAREFHEKKISTIEEVGISDPDDHTLIVRFKEPQPNWELKTAFWPFFPVRKDLVEKFGNNWWQPGTLVSNGPFILESMESGKKAILKRNPHYPPLKTNIDRIEIDFVKDRELIYSRFEKKFYPFVQGVNESKYLKSKKFKEIPILRHYALALNAGRFPMSNRKFRKAIFSSISIKELINGLGLLVTQAKSLVPEKLIKSKEAYSFSFNPEQSREFLKSSGIILDKSIKLSIASGINESSEKIGRAIASQIEKTLNFPVSSIALKPKEFETFSNLGDYSMTLISWTAKVPEARDFLLPYSHQFLANNKTRTVIPEFEEAVKKNDIEYALQIISKEEAVIQPLFFERIGYLSHSNISELYFDHMGLPILKNVNLKVNGK